MLALVFATLLQVSPSPVPPPRPAAASVSDGAGCDDDGDALFPSPLGHGCPGTPRPMSEPGVLDDEDRFLEADDPEAAWDRAFDDEREPLDGGWEWSEE